ncbi:MAG: arylsulfatase [Verrucomicrobiales bacterium]|nr:arylsulfatase [Verrucomicrobiales bacterium]
MKRTIALLFILFTVSAFAADHPNIIVIYTDDQGYGDAGNLNPDSKFATPALDRLAAEGMTFTDAHCSDTVCTPSRYGLLTGRYAWRTRLKSGVFGAETPCLIEGERTTLASLTRGHGYDTAMVGKWHLGMEFPGDRNNRDWTRPVTDMPLDKGFEYFYGIPASLNYGILAWFEGRHAAVPPTLYTSKKPNRIAIKDYRIMPPYESGRTDLKLPNDTGNVSGPLEIAPDFVDSECLTRFTDKTIEWLAEKRNPDKPFFVYLPYTSPHKPVIPIESFLGKSEAGAYGDFMMETDWHIGRILDWLDENDLAENTMVVFSSDNGPENTWPERLKKFNHDSNGIYREGKRSIYEGGHRVPFYVRWPAKVQPGTTYEGPVCQTDLLATLAEILDCELDDNSGEDSVSFLDVLLTGKAKKTRLPMIHHGVAGRFAVREGDWKLVMETGKKSEVRELYDLGKDPSETRSILKEHPEVEANLIGQLNEIVRSGRTTPGKAAGNDTGWWNKLVWMDEW